MSDFVNPVLESINPIILESKHVSINYDKIDGLAVKLAKEYSEGKIKLPEWRGEIYPEDGKDALEFLFLINTINFAFTDFSTKEKFQTTYNRKIYSGALAMEACIKRALDNGMEMLDPRYLELLDRKSLRQIFTGNIEIPMLNERLKILNETGGFLRKNNKSFNNLCKKSKFKTFADDYSDKKDKGIVERLVNEFPYFYDASFIGDTEIIFHKRAQLAPMIAYGRFNNESNDEKDKEFFPMSEEEIDKLTVAADYVLPKTLRALDILKYNKNLEQKIDNQIPIKHGSREEVEIRMATIYSSEILWAYSNFYLSNIPKQENKHINKGHIDSYLWFKGKSLEGKPHLCRTVAY